MHAWAAWWGFDLTYLRYFVLTAGFRFASLCLDVFDRGVHFGVPVDREIRRGGCGVFPSELQGYLKFNDAQNTVRLTLQQKLGRVV